MHARPSPAHPPSCDTGGTQMGAGAPAFQQIYDSFQPKIRHYLARIVGQDEAEDLTQEVFMKVIQGLPGFKNQSAVSTWLYRIATNAALDRLRRPAFQQARTTSAIDSTGDGSSGVDEEGAAMADE